MSSSRHEETIKDWVHAIKVLLILAAVICIGVMGFYLIVFNLAHEPFIEPTIDISEMESVRDSILFDGSDSVTIDGSEYEIYCKLKPVLKDMEFGEPFAYIGHISPAYYEYFVTVTSLTEGEWLASFKESGTEGEINRRNALYVWKRSDVDEIPGWLQEAHRKYVND